MPQLNFCLSIGHDQTLRIHDATTGAPFYAKANARRCRFTHLAWSLARHELYLVDAAGYLQIWNVYANVCVHTARLREGPLRYIGLIQMNQIIMKTNHSFVSFTLVYFPKRTMRIFRFSTPLISHLTGDCI